MVDCQVEVFELPPAGLEPDPDPELAAGAEVGAAAGFDAFSLDPDEPSLDPDESDEPAESDELDEPVSVFDDAATVDSLAPDEDPLPERLSVL